MKKIVFGTAAAGVVILAVAAGLGQAGVLDFAADSPHSPALAGLIGWARERAVARAADGIVTPADLADAERIRRGAGNYDAMCVHCHLSPGAGASELSRGLYPPPANLAERNAAASAASDARRFWIIKHGIKGSGMAAWSQGGMDDDSIWDLVAFIKILPDLSADAYRQKVRDSDGHVHAGLPAEPAAVAPTKPPSGHEHHRHAH
jgi:mono/diheme cytochrome c family protein